MLRSQSVIHWLREGKRFRLILNFVAFDNVNTGAVACLLARNYIKSRRRKREDINRFAIKSFRVDGEIFRWAPVCTRPLIDVVSLMVEQNSDQWVISGTHLWPNCFTGNPSFLPAHLPDISQIAASLMASWTDGFTLTTNRWYKNQSLGEAPFSLPSTPFFSALRPVPFFSPSSLLPSPLYPSLLPFFPALPSPSSPLPWSGLMNSR